MAGSRAVALNIALGFGLLVFCVFAAGAEAAGSPTGDRAAIAFYREVAVAYQHVSTLTVSRHGYLSYTVSGTTFRFDYGAAAAAGYRPATESITAVLNRGRVIGYVDRARARGLPPLTVIADSTGVWARLATGCYFKNPRSSDVLGWGKPFVGIIGDFAPIAKAGSAVTVTSTYAWGSTGKATEVDHFFARTKFWRSYEVQVKGTSGFSFGMSSFRESRVRVRLPTATPRC